MAEMRSEVVVTLFSSRTPEELITKNPLAGRAIPLDEATEIMKDRLTVPKEVKTAKELLARKPSSESTGRSRPPSEPFDQGSTTDRAPSD